MNTLINNEGKKILVSEPTFKETNDAFAEGTWAVMVHDVYEQTHIVIHDWIEK